MNRILSTASVALVLLSPLRLTAQVEAPLVFELPASTEALGLGTVFPVSGRDADAVFYNPGAIARAVGVGVAAQWFGADARLLNAAGALPWLGGGVGVGLQALSYDATAADAPDQSDLFTDGDVGVSELVASVGYGRALGDVQIGAVGKLVEQRISGASGSTGAVDLGATLDVSVFTLGLAVQNLGPDLTVGDTERPLPDRITLSGSFEPEPVGPLDVRLAAAVARRADGEVIPAGGVDVRFWPIQGRTFIARFGATRVPDGPARPLTFGLAFWGDAIALEYAYQGYDDTGDAHRVGVRWRQ